MNRLLLELDNVHLSYRNRHSLFRSTNQSVVKGVTLQIYAGDRIGIMGKNGAGKSTLLRLMAGIYQPDQGEIVNHGARVSLLSLQAGFDPELNGWDNAVLTGVLLGMSAKQAKSCLSQIQDFSELGNKMNEPLRTYSSGMRARLGFAVAFSLKVDVLLIDEVLSVGDRPFQNKCVKAVNSAIENGCAVVIVSHSQGKMKAWAEKFFTFSDGNLIEGLHEE
jgi:lipopolysaccharide transport system ATP-binding protein